MFGDFNSNAIWNHEHCVLNHSSFISMLKSKGIESIYHHTTSENQGEESVATYFTGRNLRKSYHIDYCFANVHIVKDFHICTEDMWLQYSDHRPMVISVVV